MALNYVRYVVHEEAVQSYIRPGGEFHTLLKDVCYDARDIAKNKLLRGGHVRSKRLYNGVMATQPNMTGPLMAAGRITSSAKHTFYFMEDTRGKRIAAKKGGFMMIPIGPVGHTNLMFAGAGSQHAAATNFKGVVAKKRVKGYKAHPFMTEALTASLIQHGLK